MSSLNTDFKVSHLRAPNSLLGRRLRAHVKLESASATPSATALSSPLDSLDLRLLEAVSWSLERSSLISSGAFFVLFEEEALALGEGFLGEGLVAWAFALALALPFPLPFPLPLPFPRPRPRPLPLSSMLAEPSGSSAFLRRSCCRRVSLFALGRANPEISDCVWWLLLG